MSCCRGVNIYSVKIIFLDKFDYFLRNHSSNNFSSVYQNVTCVAVTGSQILSGGGDRQRRFVGSTALLIDGAVEFPESDFRGGSTVIK